MRKLTEKSPRTSSIVQIIFSFWPFEVCEGILRNLKIIVGFDSFSDRSLIYLITLVFVSTTMLKGAKLQ